MALYIILIGLGWLLAAVSAVLWLRKYPGLPIGRRHMETRRGRALDVLGLAGIAPGAYGGTGLQTRYHWGLWIVPAVYLPLFLIGTAVPIIFRRRQLRRSALQAAGRDSAAGIPPAV